MDPVTPVDLIPLGSIRVRRYVINGEWYYNLDDLIAWFSEDVDYFKKLWRSFTQKRDERGYADQILLRTTNGHEERLVNAVGVFRLVQGIKGKKADEVKSWLAQIAVERIQESIDPDVALDRIIKTWYSKGRSDAWILERLRSKKVRKAFTDEMQQHGARATDYPILSNIVHQGSLGISIAEHKELKALSPSSSELREEMTVTELILLTLGEHTSTIIAKAASEKNLSTAKSACVKGGNIAGDTRKRIERELGRPVVTSQRASDEGSLPIKTV